MNKIDTQPVTRWHAIPVVAAALMLCACAGTENMALKSAKQSYAKTVADPTVTANPASADYLAQADLNLYHARWLSYGPPMSAQPGPHEVDDLANVASGQVALAQLTVQQAQAQQKLAQLNTSDLTTLRDQEAQADNELAQLRTELAQKNNNRLAALDAKLNASLEKARKMGADVKRDGDKIDVTLNNVTFDFDKANVKDEYVPVLKQIAEGLSERYPSAVLKIFGYTDSVGTPQYNQQLSDKRAAAVKELLGKLGVDENRITARGLGESAPIASNDTPQGRERNRRVELLIQGKPE
jgi:outer membrane protein OmpA-like peptidoglycan-associated protein